MLTSGLLVSQSDVANTDLATMSVVYELLVIMVLFTHKTFTSFVFVDLFNLVNISRLLYPKEK